MRKLGYYLNRHLGLTAIIAFCFGVTLSFFLAVLLQSAMALSNGYALIIGIIIAQVVVHLFLTWVWSHSISTRTQLLALSGIIRPISQIQ